MKATNGHDDLPASARVLGTTDGEPGVIQNALAHEYENKLRAILSTMNGTQCGKIRDAYDRAVRSLRRLAEALETADLDLGGHESEEHRPLIEEHLIACAALETMERSVLGKVCPRRRDWR